MNSQIAHSNPDPHPPCLQASPARLGHLQVPLLYLSGDHSLLERPCVAVVGSREASADGLGRARRLARELLEAGVVVMSGLARGIDTAAHLEAIQRGGRTIGVLGTGLDQFYPRENRSLQEYIGRLHLLVSPFAAGTATRQGNFPLRNRIMAQLSAATVILEGSDRTGTLHQARECERLGRPLFIAASVWNDPGLSWPHRFTAPTTRVLTETRQVLEAIGA